MVARKRRGEDGKPLLKCSKWPWVSIAPGCFERAVGKRGVYPSLNPCARPRNHPSTDGRELREFAMIPLAVGARKHTGRIGWSAYGLPRVRRAIILGLMLFPQDAMDFFFSFLFETTIRRRVFVELGAFLPLFDFCFNLRSFYVVFFFLFGFRHSRMSIDWLSFSCVIFLFFFLLCIFDITLMHASDMRVKKEHYIDLWFDICIFDSIAGIDGMV